MTLRGAGWALLGAGVGAVVVSIFMYGIGAEMHGCHMDYPSSTASDILCTGSLQQGREHMQQGYVVGAMGGVLLAAGFFTILAGMIVQAVRESNRYAP